MMATLTGGAPAASSGTSPAGNSILQDLDNVFSNQGTVVASTNGAQPPPPTDNTSGGQPSGGNDSSVDEADWGDGPSGAGGGWQQQYALSAYASGNVSGLDATSVSASALQGISV
jgi:hypothetical protein